MRASLSLSPDHPILHCTTFSSFPSVILPYLSYLGLFVFFALEKYLFPVAKKSKEDRAGASKRSASASKSKGH